MPETPERAQIMNFWNRQKTREECLEGHPLRAELEKVELLINELPDHPRDIAAVFHVQGVKAIPGCPQQCVIAQWLLDQTGVQFTVYPGGVRTPIQHQHRQVQVAFPTHVYDFIEMFDNHMFPELIV